MRKMQRSVRQKVVAAAAVAVLLGGCAFAAVSATAQSNGQRHGKRARHGARHLRARDLAAAASYLGTSTTALSSELRSGKSLARIATANGSRKTASGLVEAIVAERNAQLANAAANLSKRVSVEVQRPGGPFAGVLGKARARFCAQRRSAARRGVARRRS
jgi:hypothetical protein